LFAKESLVGECAYELEPNGEHCLQGWSTGIDETAGGGFCAEGNSREFHLSRHDHDREQRRCLRERLGLEQRVTKRYPIGRLGTPLDVAECAVYLASDESSFVTGTSFVVDGGLMAGRKVELDYT
jgi:NAD(P)-dependent dehydrogenase (short-subunit alcohol dehydrogenase family)